MVAFQVQVKQPDGSFKLVDEPTPDMREQVGICNVCGKEVYVRSGPKRTYWAHRYNETCEPKPGFVPMVPSVESYATNAGAVKNPESKLEEEFAATHPAPMVNWEPVILRERESDVSRSRRLSEEMKAAREEQEKERADHRRRMDDAISYVKSQESSEQDFIAMTLRRHQEEVHTANDFNWNCPIDAPIVRLDLPWVTLWALSKRQIFSLPMGDFKIERLVRAQLFLKPSFTYEDYRNDRASLVKVVERGELAKALPYEELLPHAGHRLRNALVQPDLTGEHPMLRFWKLEK